MCFGCSKEPSHWDGSFEYPQHMFWLRNKKSNIPIRSLIWRPVLNFELVSSIRYKLACPFQEDSDYFKWVCAFALSDQSLSFPTEKNILLLAILQVLIKDWSDCVDAQADLSLWLVHMPTCTFCLDTGSFIISLWLLLVGVLVSVQSCGSWYMCTP